MEILHWSASLRRIWDNLFTSRYERYLRQQIEQLTHERDSYRDNCHRLQQAIMPLTIPGARYVQDIKGPQKSEPIKPRSDTWAGMQAEHVLDLEEFEKSTKEKN